MSKANEILQELDALLASDEFDLEGFDLGPVSAYAIAKAHGFTGTEKDFAEMIVNAAQNAADASASKQAAAASKESAERSASAAAGSASAAAGSASSASGSASSANRSATAAEKAAASAASSASAASVSATSAGNSATDANTAKVAAEKANDEAKAVRDEIFDVLNNATILDTTETVTFNIDDLVDKIVHTSNKTGLVVRTDVFTYNGSTVTEVRTAADGRTQTNVYDLETLSQQFNV